jgi:hypothetical protein
MSNTELWLMRLFVPAQGWDFFFFDSLTINQAGHVVETRHHQPSDSDDETRLVFILALYTNVYVVVYF